MLDVTARVASTLCHTLLPYASVRASEPELTLLLLLPLLLPLLLLLLLPTHRVRAW
jgi:hypothetical protein